MKISPAGVLEIAEHEGIVLGPYKDSRGIWTFGVGHTAAAGGPDPALMPKEDTRQLSPELREARMLVALKQFDRDLDLYEARVREAAQGVTLAQHQFDALVSWDFNTGGATWRGRDGHRARLVRQMRAGTMTGEGFMGWLRPPEIKGRRQAEQRLFQTGDYDANGDRIQIYDALNDGRIRAAGTVSGRRLAELMAEAGTRHTAAPAADIPDRRTTLVGLLILTATAVVSFLGGFLT